MTRAAAIAPLTARVSYCTFYRVLVLLLEANPAWIEVETDLSSAMVLKSPYNWTQLRLCMFARARPRGPARGVANLGTSSSVPENGSSGIRIRIRYITSTHGNTISSMSKKRLSHSPRIRRDLIVGRVKSGLT